MSVDGYGYSASHGALTGLTNDDHTQYLQKVGGTVTGNLTVGDGSTGRQVIVYGGGSNTWAARLNLSVVSKYRGNGMYHSNDENTDTWFAGVPYASNFGRWHIGYGAAGADPTVQSQGLFYMGINGDAYLVGSDARLWVQPGGTASTHLPYTNGYIYLTTLAGAMVHRDYAAGGGYTSYWVSDSTGFRPEPDNVRDLGTSTRRWNDAFVTNGVTSGSDELIKEDIQDSDLGLEFIQQLRPIRFKHKDRNRPHYGLGAQQVKEVLDNIGVEDFAGYVDPSVNFEPYVYKSPEEDELNEDLEPGPLGLRYNEFIGPLIKAVQQLTERVEQLEIA